MLEALLKVCDGQITLKVSADTPKNLFAEIASLQEVFGENKCGVCGRTVLQFRVRNVAKGNQRFEYYELLCKNPECRARLAFGQSMDKVSLFPKRKDDNGYLPDGGWERYVKPADGKKEPWE